MLKQLSWLLLLALLTVLLSVLAWQRLQQIELSLDEALFNVDAGSSAIQLCHRWQQQGRLNKLDCQLLRVYLKLNPSAAAV